MLSQDAIFTNKIFLNAALPLVKTIATDVPSLAKCFEHAHAVIQVSALCDEVPEGKVGMHFVVNGDVEKDGEKGTEWLVHTCLTKDPQIELEFKSVEALNGFFKGNITLGAIPKIHGIKKAGTLVSFVRVLLKMSSVLTAKEAPKDVKEQELMVKCFFYLLSSGISQLNKAGHEDVHNWALKSPDRVYAWAVDGNPQVSAYIRVKAGKTRAGRGEYKRAMPFFTMRFDSYESALGILLGTADMLESVRQGKLIMDGAPEFGGQIGTYMLTVAGYAQ
ncbi:MAG: hypothetical protein NC122_05455 [Faecalibacterium sp.]|nr:hypothetical protein [Ruminococcus sp.]MCM1392559.1 hypothetical protein [Ruminococcus sp.]MCM1485634.1 hypothetical protein [Faecalibacterium sp.]